MEQCQHCDGRGCRACNPLADECRKLLDNHWRLMLFANTLGSYTAIAIRPEQSAREALAVDSQVTDGFTPSTAIYRLCEKLLCDRMVTEEETVVETKCRICGCKIDGIDAEHGMCLDCAAFGWG